MSLQEPFPAFTTGVCRVSGLSNVAAASLASPMTEKQSGRLEVISNSTLISSRPIASQIGCPG